MKLLFIKFIGSLLILYSKLFKKEGFILIVSHDDISRQYDSVYCTDEDRDIELSRLLYSSFDVNSDMKKAAEISLRKINDEN
jgi:hypothetical protein